MVVKRCSEPAVPLSGLDLAASAGAKRWSQMFSSAFDSAIDWGENNYNHYNRYLYKTVSCLELRAERLNLFLERSEHAGPEGIDQPATSAISEPKPPKTRKEKWVKRLRIVLPHVGLVLLSTLYAVLGAVMFYCLEQPNEILLRNQSAHRILMLKEQIADELWSLSRMDNVSELSWKQRADEHLDDVIRGVFNDYTKNYMTPNDLIDLNSSHVKWTFGASLFFAWTAITTIGYGHIVPKTMNGRIACLVYALLGIPLVLVTIADMGRFLSGGIIWVHQVFARFHCWLKKCCWNCMVSLRHCRFVRRRKKTHSQANQRKAHPQVNLKLVDRSPDKSGTFEDISDIQTHSQQSPQHTPSQDTNARADELLEELPPEQQERRISVLFVLLLMLGYTAGGAMLLRLWENWTFFDSFYYCFVTVTTIGFGDIVPQSESFLWATLAYIVLGLIITTMCIDLVGSEYIRDIHFYGRSLGRSFMTFGGKVVHLGEVFGYVAFLQRNYGITPEQLDKLANLPDTYLLDCMMHGRQPDLHWQHGRPFIPDDIYYFKWIEQPRTLSFASEKILASMESLDYQASRCSTTRTMTPREYYQHILMQYCKDNETKL